MENYGGIEIINIFDISMTRLGGPEAAKIIRRRDPGRKILLLTMHRDKLYFSRAQVIGVNGYVLKDEADNDLNSAIRIILQGDSYIAPLLGNT